ncbi:MAG: branched-chain amino acid ABC transporter permease [Desulfovibrionaceae bacterium]|jgi:branched-chain amino acid transport system permease protein|nr:branched-chain amino acid ABC transporter permease [Desulfovibrionaceae bacterium]
MDFASILQYLISGLTVGATYGLTALGFTIIYNTTGIINFAQGEFVMLGGMFSVFFLNVTGLPLPLAVAAAVAATVAVGAFIERCTIRPVKHPTLIQLIIVTIGVSIVIRGLAMLVWGKDTFALPAFTGETPLRFLGATILPQNLWILGITLVLLAALKRFFAGTMFGRAMLACSHNKKAAYLSGIDVQRMVLFSFMLSAFIGSVGGAILAPITMASYDRGILLGLKGFAACILGGLGNPFGAAAGGLILGVLESFGAGFVSSAYKDAFAFLILLGLLFVRPSGLFGKSAATRA